MNLNLRLLANLITHPLFVWCYIDLLLSLQHAPFFSFSVLFASNILFPAILFAFYMKFQYRSFFPFSQIVQMTPEDRLVLISFTLLGLALFPSFLSSTTNLIENTSSIHLFWAEWLLSLFFLLLVSLFCTPSLHLYSWALLFAFYMENQWIDLFSWVFFFWILMILIIWVLRWLEGHHSFLELLLGFIIGYSLFLYKEIIFWLVS